MKEFNIKDYIGEMSPEEVKAEILDKIKIDKRYNSWNGHAFRAPNGWRFKTGTICGGFGNWPIGEIVTVTDSEKNIILEFEYPDDSSNYDNIIGPLYEYFYNLLDQEDHSIKQPLAVAASEYLYALRIVEKKD